MAEHGRDVVELEVRGVVVGLFRENCWIIGSRKSGEALVIDPGDEPEVIMALARDMGVSIKQIVASHAHLDHVLAARVVRELTAATFLMHQADQGILDEVPASSQRLLGFAVPPPPKPDAYMRDGDDVEVAGITARVIHTPGHTPGSVSIYVPEAGLLFSGDTLFYDSIGRTDLPGGSFGQEMRSIVDQLLVLPDDTRVLPGHMAETTIGRERAENPFIRQAFGR